jgi:SAM-dependent methyltransferase
MPRESRVTGRDERTACLGALASLFDDRFVRSCDLYEKYVEGLAGRAFEATGLAAVCDAPRTVGEAVSAAGLDEARAGVPAAWLFAMLAARGALARDGDRYRLAAALADADLDAPRAAQAANDPGCLPAYDLAAYAAQHYPDVLSGRTAGEQVLSDPAALDLWGGYFSNANALYAVSNALGARAAATALEAYGGSVLELGAGLGSAAEALLERAPAAAVAAYRVTDASPLFVRRAKRALEPRFKALALQFAGLDIDAPFAAAGIAPRSQALVYAVNVLHVARDLAATLGEIRDALAPGGSLVFAECIRPRAGQPLHAEFVFNLLGAFRAPVLQPPWRPNGGFLTAAEWTAALEANGFGDVRVVPDLAAIRDHYPSFVVGAITARPA